MWCTYNVLLIYNHILENKKYVERRVVIAKMSTNIG